MSGRFATYGTYAAGSERAVCRSSTLFFWEKWYPIAPPCGLTAGLSDKESSMRQHLFTTNWKTSHQLENKSHRRGKARKLLIGPCAEDFKQFVVHVQHFD